MATYRYYSVDVRTGRVMTELPLRGGTFERHLDVGSFSADLPMSSRNTWTRLQELDDLTRPWRYTVALERDGAIVGEWVITGRPDRGRTGVIKLTGSELTCYADRVFTRPYSVTNRDQLQISLDLAQMAFVTGGVALDTSQTVVASGVPRDRTYLRAESNVGQRWRELSQVENGFDYTIEPEWNSIGGLRYVRRRLMQSYPRAGIHQPFRLEVGIPGDPGGNVRDFRVAEDGNLLAGRVWTLGAGEGDSKVIGEAYDSSLEDAGYPLLESSQAFSSVTSQETADGHAREILRVAQSAEVPPTLTVKADKYPRFGDYGLGDTMYVVIAPTPTIPGGYGGQVRILGWTLRPPGAANEVVQLQATGA